MIRDCSAEAPPATTSVEIAIIGSGCAGATAAWVLAEAGHEVLILEEGSDRTSTQLTQRDAEMYDQLYMDRGGRMTQDLTVAVLQGRVLGGGGVINASDVVPLSDEVLELWQRRFGLTQWSPANLRAARARALEDLSANHIDPAQLNRNNTLMRKGSLELGLRGEIMQHNRLNCAGLGTCMIGCPINAKRNPRMVAIPAALEAGASAWTRARVVRIEQGEAEQKRLIVRPLDAKGYHEQGEVIVTAKTVILAANAVGSAALLLRSGLGNDQVGRHLSLQPQLPIMADFDEQVIAFRGIPQAYAVTEGERFDDARGVWGFRIEPIMGTPGIVATLLPFSGPEAKEWMTRYPYIAASLLLVPDEPVGQVSVSRGGRILVDYTLPEDVKQRYREALDMSARAYLAAGARSVLVPSLPPVLVESSDQLERFRELQFPPASVPLVSAHQQGAVRAAPNQADGAADPDGLIYGTRGIYCFDSGLYPTSSSSHTMAPILATSRWLAEGLTARLSS